MPVDKMSSGEEDSGAEEETDGIKSASSKRACVSFGLLFLLLELALEGASSDCMLPIRKAWRLKLQDYCHRMKMRCINKENPPCNRCRQGGHACTFNGPRKTKASRVEDRLKLVEVQMTTFQSSLQELLQLQRANIQVASSSPGQAVQPYASHPSGGQLHQPAPSYALGRDHSVSVGSKGYSTSHSPTTSFHASDPPVPPPMFNMASIEGYSGDQARGPLRRNGSLLASASGLGEYGGTGGVGGNGSIGGGYGLGHLLGQDGAGASLRGLDNSSTGNTFAMLPHRPQMQSHTQSQSDYSRAHPLPQTQSKGPLQPHDYATVLQRTRSDTLSRPTPPGAMARPSPSSGSQHAEPSKGTRSPRSKRTQKTADGTLARLRSRSGSSSSSEGEDLDPAIASASFPGPWRSMLSLAEAARLKADNQLSKEDIEDGNRSGNGGSSAARQYEGDNGPRAINGVVPNSAQRREPSIDGETAQSTSGGHHPFHYPEPDKKRRRSTMEEQHTGLKGALPVQKGSQKHAYKDPVEVGMIDLERGRALYESFMQNCNFYIPVFDPEQDTWDSMRQRSPFVIAAALYIGLKCEEAGGIVSELQDRLREHAEKIGMSTLFTPVARIEVVQALIIMAQWGDTSYRPGGHALRIATEMGLWRCLPYLVQTGMGAGKTPAELTEERPLVVGARVWLTLFKTECQMAFNSGRPVGLSLDSMKDARRLLNHPLAIATDSRLVPFCELQIFRLPLHTPYTIWPSTSHIPDLDEKLRAINQEFIGWFAHWDSYYEQRGYPAEALLRVTLTTMLCGTQIYANAIILNGVRNKRDVSLLSEERHGFLLKAVQAAEALMTTAFHGEKGKQYINRFRYANLNTHVNFAFIARFLIRMSSLVPEMVNLRQVGRDVEMCAKTLSNVPGFQFAQLLRDILLRARKKHVLPPPSRAPSPPRALASSSRMPTTAPDAYTSSNHPSIDPALTSSSMRQTPALAQSYPFSQASTQPTNITSPNGGMGMGANGVSMISGFSPYGSEGAMSTSGLGLPELDFGLAEQLFSEGSAGGWGGVGGGFGFEADGSSTLAGPIEQNLGFDPWHPFPPLDNDFLSLNLPPFSPGADTSERQQGGEVKLEVPLGGGGSQAGYTGQGYPASTSARDGGSGQGAAGAGAGQGATTATAQSTPRWW